MFLIFKPPFYHCSKLKVPWLSSVGLEREIEANFSTIFNNYQFCFYVQDIVAYETISHTQHHIYLPWLNNKLMFDTYIHLSKLQKRTDSQLFIFCCFSTIKQNVPVAYGTFSSDRVSLTENLIIFWKFHKISLSNLIIFRNFNALSTWKG